MSDGAESRTHVSIAQIGARDEHRRHSPDVSSAEAVVVVAAGAGRRLGGQRPKALVELEGRPMLAWALDGVRSAGLDDDAVVVVHSPGHADAFAASAGAAVCVSGGVTRTDSVRAGLAALGPEVEVVGVHDAARCLTPPGVIRAALDAVDGDTVAAAPGLEVSDTLKRTDDDEVVGTVARDGLVAVQTPQVFRRGVLETAMTAAPADLTDDLALVERARDAGAVTGGIRLVAGSPLGFKITHPRDLELARTLLRASGV